ncbi:unnamed protein product [Caenorhabditis brenneri]
MKIFFIIALCILTSVVAKPPENMTDVDKYNMLRWGFAQTNNISNMWHLTETPSLESYGQYFKDDCTTKKLPFVGLPFRYFWTEGGMAAKHFDGYWIRWLKHFEKTDPQRITAMHKLWEKTTAWFLEYTNPLQTEIWCFSKTCTLTPQPQEKDFYMKEYPKSITFTKLCILAEETKFSFYLPIHQKSGKKPGSECGPNGENINGICYPK